jgi:hypothetical protein
VTRERRLAAQELCLAEMPAILRRPVGFPPSTVQTSYDPVVGLTVSAAPVSVKTDPEWRRRGDAVTSWLTMECKATGDPESSSRRALACIERQWADA